MKIFDNGILCLTEVHGLILKPRDLSREEFQHLQWFLNIKVSNILECSSTPTAVIESGIASTFGEVRRMVKENSLNVGARKITNFDDILTEEDFFETGYEGLKWTPVRRGKKGGEVVLIWEDAIMYPNDPWFGLSLDEWKELITK